MSCPRPRSDWTSTVCIRPFRRPTASRQNRLWGESEQTTSPSPQFYSRRALVVTALAKENWTRLFSSGADPDRIAFALQGAVSARCFASLTNQWPFLRVRRGRIGDRRVISRGTLLAPIARQEPSKRRRSIRRGWAVVPEVPRVCTPKPRIRSFRLLTSWLHRFRVSHRIFFRTSFRQRRDTQSSSAVSASKTNSRREHSH
jgi:hypothetical protein